MGDLKGYWQTRCIGCNWSMFLKFSGSTVPSGGAVAWFGRNTEAFCIKGEIQK